MSPPTLRHVEGARASIFQKMHAAMMAVDIDFSTLRAEGLPEARKKTVIATWQSRFQTEFRSIQIMTRFMTELLGAGEPLEVYAGAVDLIEDEIRHAALCARLVEALGGEVLLPQPAALVDPQGFLATPMPMRALATAVGMLAVSETLSVAFIRDLQARCEQPAIRGVLDATVADEDEHEDFGWAYIELALGRMSDQRGFARDIAKSALAPHRAMIERHLGPLRADPQDLTAFPEPELARFGLFGPVRQALVADRVIRETIVPRLAALGLVVA